MSLTDACTGSIQSPAQSFVQGVPFIAVLSTAAVTGCPGGCRLCMRYSYHAMCGGKKKRSVLHSLLSIVLFSFSRRLSQNCERRLLASSCLSVHRSAWNISVPIGGICMKFDIWGFFENLSRKFKFFKTWQDGLYTFIMYRWSMLRMLNPSDISCTENHNTHFVFNTLFPKTVPFMRQCRILWYRYTWQHNTVQKICKNTDTLSVCNNYCFVTH